jgi:hypothetical protein
MIWKSLIKKRNIPGSCFFVFLSVMRSSTIWVIQLGLYFLSGPGKLQKLAVGSGKISVAANQIELLDRVFLYEW